MGKTRKRGTGNQPTEPISDKPSSELVEKMLDWQKYPATYDSPADFLSEEKIQYVKEHMKNISYDNVPSGHMYRMERGSHFEDKYYDDEYDIGSQLQDSSVFRSFSRDSSSTAQYLMEHANGEPVVIYRTSGNVQHYDISKHTHFREHETESWVEPKKLKIDEVTYYNDADDNIKDVIIDTVGAIVGIFIFSTYYSWNI